MGEDAIDEVGGELTAAEGDDQLLGTGVAAHTDEMAQDPAPEVGLELPLDEGGQPRGFGITGRLGEEATAAAHSPGRD